jgi:transposase
MRRYPSDLTDEQWTVLEPEARVVMAELTRTAGRPMVHDLRAMVDAIGYVVRYGIEWRALPADFPPHQAVYAFFCRWSARGLPQRLADRLRGRIRIAAGRAELPTAGSIDSQTVKAWRASERPYRARPTVGADGRPVRAAVCLASRGGVQRSTLRPRSTVAAIADPASRLGIRRQSEQGTDLASRF